MRVSEADHRMVTAAVSRAEATTDGEIATIVTERSDAYGDIALIHSAAVAGLVLALLALFPAILPWLRALPGGGWEQEHGLGELLAIALLLVTAAGVAARLALRSRALLMAMTPGPIKARRVRAAALRAFRIGTEGRTAQANGVLLYLSLDEHRAEIVADRGVHATVAPEAWGDAMAALLAGVKDGRPGDGMADAVAQIGTVLAAHFPRTGTDPNEMPDRLIAL